MCEDCVGTGIPLSWNEEDINNLIKDFSTREYKFKESKDK